MITVQVWEIIPTYVVIRNDSYDDDTKDIFYEELECVFNKFPKYHKMLLGDFNAKVGREHIFKSTVANESLHEISNNNEVRPVNFATSKNLTIKITMFPHHNIHKFTWTSPDTFKCA
jgi:hypothetical protein